MLKFKSKSDIFREAWQIARDAASRWGGPARSYLGAALRSIYADLRKAAFRAVYHSLFRAQYVNKTQFITNGVYETMIALNMPSKATATTPVAATGVVATAIAKVSAIAVKAFNFIKKVFTFTPVKEVALE